MGLMDRWDRRNQRRADEVPVDAGTDADIERRMGKFAPAYRGLVTAQVAKALVWVAVVFVCAVVFFVRWLTLG
jgi:hypothetical protein